MIEALSRPPSVHLILIVVQAMFASLAVIGRLALLTVPPAAVVFVRVGGGAIVFAVLASLGGRLRLERRDVPRLALCAVLGVGLNQLLFIYGLSHTTATNAVVLVTTIPVFTLLFAIVARQEKARVARLAGIVIAFVGALVLVRVERFSIADEVALGNAMVVANCACYALFLVIVKPLTTRYRPLALVALLFIFAAPLVALTTLRDAANFAPSVTPREVGLLLFILAVPTVGAYALNQVALKRAESSLVAAYVYLQPLFAAFGAALLLDERPGPRTGVGAVLIFAGVYITSRRRAARLVTLTGPKSPDRDQPSASPPG